MEREVGVGAYETARYTVAEVELGERRFRVRVEPLEEGEERKTESGSGEGERREEKERERRDERRWGSWP